MFDGRFEEKYNKGLPMTVPKHPQWWAELEARLKECYQMLPEAMGTVLLVVQDEATEWLIRVEMGESLEFGAATSANEHTDTQLVLALPVLLRILQDPLYFEPRNDFFLRNVRVSGVLYLAHHFAHFLKRPGDYALKVMEYVRAYPQIPSAVLESQEWDFSLLLRCVTTSQPLVFRKIFDWPAQSWSLDELDAHMGALAVRFNPLEQREETVADLTKSLRLQNDARVYVSGFVLPVEVGKYFPFSQELESCTTPIQMWLGRSRSGRFLTKLHADIFTSLLTQVWGKKKVRLYPPQHHNYVYPISAFSGSQLCMVDPLNPDLVRYPEFAKAQCFEVEIGPGDMLVMPPGWFHCVEAEGLTFSISRGLPLELAFQRVNAAY